MSDTNSKGGKKDTDKIQIIKVGSDSFSEIFTKKEPDGFAPQEPSDIQTGIDHPIEPVYLDDAETGLTAEEQIARLTPSPSSHPSKDDGQLELLKRYVTLKETEIKDLRDQAKQYQAFIKKVTNQLDSESSHAREYLTELETLRLKESQLKKELEKIKERHEGEINLLRSNYEAKIDSLSNVKNQASEFEQKKEAWSEKVKEDLKRIKLKEKELENKYELLRRDTQALLDSKDKHVLELKKKNDALEIELESFEDKLRQANAILSAVESKKHKAMDALRLITSLMEDLNAETVPLDKERKAG